MVDPSPLPHAPRAAVIYNPTKVDLKELRLVVAEAERKSGWAPSSWMASDADDAGTAAARAAVAAGVDLALVAGGDGTVRAVAEQLQGTGISVALIPSGTGNLLARNLGLNVGIVEAVRTAFAGRDREIDVATAELTRADGSEVRVIFMVMAGVGFDAAMAENTNEELKRRVGWLAYVDPIARSVMGGRRFAMRYRVDDGPIRSVRAHTVIVGNCGTVTANILLMPDAVVDDGLLDVALFRPARGIAWVRIGARIAIHGLLHRSRGGRVVMSATRELPGLRRLQAGTLEGRFAEPQLVQLDGDGFGMIVGVRVSVQRRALVIRVPEPTPAVASVASTAGSTAV